MLSKIIRVLGHILLWAGVALVVTGLVSIWYFDGFWKLAETISPFNVWNWLAVVATLLPGFLLLKLANYLDSRTNP